MSSDDRSQVTDKSFHIKFISIDDNRYVGVGENQVEEVEEPGFSLWFKNKNGEETRLFLSKSGFEALAYLITQQYMQGHIDEYDWGFVHNKDVEYSYLLEKDQAKIIRFESDDISVNYSDSIIDADNKER